MGKGKAAAQAAHAACEVVLSIIRSNNSEWSRWLDSWLSQGQKKVVLRVESEGELNMIYEEARAAGLPASMIEDAGLTQLPPGTKTAVAIGPAPAELVDKITGKLKLY
ncbi:peptidyl-tRNA hydrolase Pth2 [Acidilobus sp.]|uniref:peptidyl-tRNA hydrolase Pth2 n=1 Tax=Acidilobus sp. TaxID=1872109 RepID=UPI003D0819E7